MINLQQIVTFNSVDDCTSVDLKMISHYKSISRQSIVVSHEDATLLKLMYPDKIIHTMAVGEFLKEKG